MLHTALMLDGWLEFNRHKWGVDPIRLRLSASGHELPAIETVFYVNRKSQIVMPPINAYLPVVFHSTPTDKRVRRYRQWLEVSGLLAEEFKKRGIAGGVSLPPEVGDVRSWLWQGFLAEVRYTFHIPLPLNLEDVDHQVRKCLKKAGNGGYICAMAAEVDWPEVIAVLRDTEERQKFEYRLTEQDLAYLKSALGSEFFRVYVCRGPSGEMASVRAVLHSPGGTSIDWVAGTHRNHLPSGATQLLIRYVLDDLHKCGAAAFDFAGANLPTVSASKASLGGELVPYYVVRPPNLRALAWLARRAWNYRRR